MANHEENTKTLEARVAELEDKLAKISITEEEMKAYQKVAAALGPTAAPPVAAQPPAAQMAAAPQMAATQAQPLAACYRYWQPQYWQHQYWQQQYWQHQQCWECGSGGPAGPGPGSFSGFGR